MDPLQWFFDDTSSPFDILEEFFIDEGLGNQQKRHCFSVPRLKR